MKRIYNKDEGQSTENVWQERIQNRLRHYESKVDVRRDTHFELKQMRELTKGGYRLDIRTPKIGMRVDFKPPHPATSKKLTTRPLYRVVFSGKTFTYQTLDQMLLWLYRRAETAMKINRALSSTIYGIASKIEKDHNKYDEQ